MKKIIMFLFALIIVFSANDVYAQDQYKLTLEKVNGVYFSRKGKNYNDDSYPYYLYKFGDIFAYCIEPGKHITTYTYVGNDGFVDLGFSDELKEKLELIGYYGRDYPGHNNIRYSMATQALIWELTGVDTVTYWTKQNEGGEEIDVSKERNEILRLVNNHKTLPSFKGFFTTSLRQELILEDTNNVIGDFDIISIHNTFVEGNKLHIIPKETGTDYIKLIRKDYNKDYKTIIFVGKDDGTAQKIARLHYGKEIRSDIAVITEGIKVVVHKQDENNNPIKLANIKFQIKNKKGWYICSGQPNCIHTTNEDGIFITEPLPKGEYEIEEIENQIIPGYIRNNNKLTFKIDDETNIKYNDELKGYTDIYFTNQSIRGSLEINKKGEEVEFSNNNISYHENSLGNIVFDIYDSNNKLVNTIITDHNGYGKVDDLKVGNYYLQEKNESNNYIIQDKIEFSIQQEDNNQEIINVNLNITNILKKGKLEFSKQDIDTKEGISNTIIGIYDINDNLLITKKTDNTGKIIIDNLPYGKYYIKEQQANNNYQISNELIEFEIKEDGEVIKKTLYNKKILGTLEIIKLAENYHYIDNELVYEKELIPNIEFSIYDMNDNLVSSIKTNNDGYASYANLPLGKYYFIEQSHLDNYIVNDNKYYFEIEKDNSNKAINVKREVVNFLKKGKLDFSKVDLVTNEGINNTIIEIYDENDNLLLTRETNEFGKVIIEQLPVGKYYIIEKEANSLYMLTNEKVYFEIKENEELVETKMTNERVKIPVPKTNTKESIVAHSLFVIIFLIGLGKMYYEKKYSF